MRKFLAEIFQWKDLPKNTRISKVALHKNRSWILVQYVAAEDHSPTYNLFYEVSEKNLKHFCELLVQDDAPAIEDFILKELTATLNHRWSVQIHGHPSNMPGNRFQEVDSIDYAFASNRYIYFNSTVVIRPDVQHPSDRGKKFRVVAIDHEYGKACIRCYYPEKHEGEEQWEHIDQLSKFDEE